jgi:hypothetical protein
VIPILTEAALQASRERGGATSTHSALPFLARLDDSAATTLLSERFSRLIKPSTCSLALAVHIARSTGATVEDLREVVGLSAGRECELNLLGELILQLPPALSEWLRASDISYRSLRDARRGNPTRDSFAMAVASLLATNAASEHSG